MSARMRPLPNPYSTTSQTMDQTPANRISWRRLRKLRELIFPRLARSPEAHAPTGTAPTGTSLELTELEPRVLYSASPLGDIAIDMEQVSDANSLNEMQATESAESEGISENGFFDYESALIPDDDYSAALEAPDTRELIFLDSSVPDFELLHESLTADAAQNDRFEVIVLQSHLDGVDQISNVIANYDNISGIHIISHGSDGSVQLGNTLLQTGSLSGLSLIHI